MSTYLVNGHRLVAGEGQQSDVPGIFNGFGDGALMLGAGAGLASGPNFAGIVNIATKKIGVLIVDHQIFIGAKLANFRTRVKMISSISIITHFELLLMFGSLEGKFFFVFQILI